MPSERMSNRPDMIVCESSLSFSSLVPSYDMCCSFALDTNMPTMCFVIGSTPDTPSDPSTCRAKEKNDVHDAEPSKRNKLHRVFSIIVETSCMYFPFSERTMYINKAANLSRTRRSGSRSSASVSVVRCLLVDVPTLLSTSETDSGLIVKRPSVKTKQVTSISVLSPSSLCKILLILVPAQFLTS